MPYASDTNTCKVVANGREEAGTYVMREQVLGLSVVVVVVYMTTAG